MKVKNVRPCASGLRLRLLLLAVLVVPQLAFAAKKADFGTVPYKQTGASAQIAQPGAGVAAFPSVGNISPVSGSGWSTAGNYGVAPPATGATLNMSIMGDVGFSGVKYPFQAAYAPTKLNLFAAAQGVAAVATGGWIGAALFVGPYMLDWLTKAGGRVSPDGSALEIADITVCSVAPCTNYTLSGSAGTVSGTYHPSVCQAWADAQIAKGFTGTTYTSSSGTNCITTRLGSPSTYPWTSKTSVSPSPASWLPKSMDDIAPYMTQSTVNPDGRVVQEILDKGGDITMPTPTVTGPASVDGSETTTVNPDGTKRIEKTTYNFSNTGNTINNTTNVTTVTIKDSNNVTTSVSTATKTPAAAVPAPDPCDANPTRAGCAKLGDAPTSEKLDKKTEAVNVVAASFASSNGCPAAVPINALGRSWSISYTPLCDRLIYIKVLFLALAGVMAAYILADSFKV